ncbi:Lrp/AsnC family transcriptional regulator [Labrenzia sp. PHM005]|uniref:Lrp/AsnC family transcriptional regulator n=1 Tax=Labrenzia sp. PHM005 TaxID=2590016 RepID=UPI0011403191|nr:Lrp/AsnC family transcriptional regulator [Labrenzia sp. PHM005]QDG79334.1 Lrp/AsnC family transcriptional regulator [Labrenzia sp. PHM005]
MTHELTQQDRDLINLMQEDLPLTSHPFEQAARQLGIEEKDVVDRLLHLRDAGVLTRFGPFFDAEALGGAFCLCAIAVPEERFEEVLTKVNAFEEVAHNYQRDHKLNMWFVLATENQAGIEQTAKAIERDTGLKVLLFPKEQEFFIGFRVKA